MVGIGASAGGLEALIELLGALPPTGMAFIVVQHLDPTHESLLSEILAKKTQLAVSLAIAGEAVHPDHVYVIPADAILTVHEGLIDLKRRTSTERTFPVDRLFSSLAVAYRDGAIGVVLSGADADGSMGLREIKQAGGFTFAQRPESARFPHMPQHAIETGCVDLVLRPIEIASELARLSRRFPTPDPAPGAKSPDPPAARPEDDAALLGRMFQRLRSAHGVDFTHYKRTTIKRRIERRMMLLRIESLEDYCAVLDGDPVELAALYQDFLIRVTEFFRDPAAFDALPQYVLPILCEGRSTKQPIRIWVPGCATGEEVYSVAITLLEYLGEGPPPMPVQIFGTDVSEAALQKARAGVYPANALHDVSAERLERFFVRQNSEYRIAKEIRDLCLFARQDVTRDPPFSRLDLISCRNLLDLPGRSRAAPDPANLSLRASSARDAVFWACRRASPSRSSCLNRSKAGYVYSAECPTQAGAPSRSAENWWPRLRSSPKAAPSRYTSTPTRCRAKPTACCWRVLRRPACS